MRKASGLFFVRRLASGMFWRAIKSGLSMFLHPDGGRLNRFDDLVISRAPTHDPFNPFPDLLLAGLWILLQQGVNGHDHAGRTVAALDGSGLYVRLLNGVEAVPFGQALNGQDLTALCFQSQGQAAVNRLPVQNDRAVPALSLPAASLRPG